MRKVGNSKNGKNGDMKKNAEGNDRWRRKSENLKRRKRRVI